MHGKGYLPYSMKHFLQKDRDKNDDSRDQCNSPCWCGIKIPSRTTSRHCFWFNTPPSILLERSFHRKLKLICCELIHANPTTSAELQLENNTKTLQVLDVLDEKGSSIIASLAFLVRLEIKNEIFAKKQRQQLNREQGNNNRMGGGNAVRWGM